MFQHHHLIHNLNNNLTLNNKKKKKKEKKNWNAKIKLQENLDKKSSYTLKHSIKFTGHWFFFLEIFHFEGAINHSHTNLLIWKCFAVLHHNPEKIYKPPHKSIQSMFWLAEHRLVSQLCNRIILAHFANKFIRRVAYWLGLSIPPSSPGF